MCSMIVALESLSKPVLKMVARRYALTNEKQRRTLMSAVRPVANMWPKSVVFDAL